MPGQDAAEETTPCSQTADCTTAQKTWFGPGNWFVEALITISTV